MTASPEATEPVVDHPERSSNFNQLKFARKTIEAVRILQKILC